MDIPIPVTEKGTPDPSISVNQEGPFGDAAREAAATRAEERHAKRNAEGADDIAKAQKSVGATAESKSTFAKNQEIAASGVAN